MANNINIVITAQDKASKPIRDVGDEMDGASGKTSKFSSALRSLGGVLKTAAITGTIAAGVFAGTGAVIGFQFNNAVQQAETKLLAFTGDAEKVADTLAWVKKEAADTQFSFTDMADAAAQLTPVAKSSGVALEDLVRQAEVLAALNPAEGLNGAVFSLREALSGDWVSIMDRFNIPRKRINELKDQGVPAMEIISKTLGEMGINYDLVAKQGQTVSARWEQITDQLNMMAGAATKPIFDRVAKELDGLAKFDFDAVGRNLAGVTQNVLGAFDLLASGDFKSGMFAEGIEEDSKLVDFLLGVRDVAKEVGDYLGPKFESAANVVQDKLFPSLEKLWKQVLQPLIPVIGTLLVGALGGLVDAFGWALQAVSPFISFLADNQWVIWGVVGALAAVKGALFIQSQVTAFQTAFETAMLATQGSIATTGGKMKAFQSLVSTPLTIGIAVGAAMAAIAAVYDAYQKMREAVNNANSKAMESVAATRSTFDGAAKAYAAGDTALGNRLTTLGQQQLKRDLESAKTDKYMAEAMHGSGWALSGQTSSGVIPAFASGTNSAPGGWSLVGEHGPELRKLGRGDHVVPAYRTRSDSTPARQGASVVIENLNNYYPNDQTRLIRDIGFALELA